jgi:hypothetical protein
MGTFPYERSSIERGQIAINDMTLQNGLSSGASGAGSIAHNAQCVPNSGAEWDAFSAT